MRPEAAEKLVRMAAVMRRRGPVLSLLPELTRELLAAVNAESVRYDLSDEHGKLWSRVVRPGQEPERPGLGAVSPLRSKEALVRVEEEGVHAIVLPLGLGDSPAGRLVLKRRSGAFTDEEERILQSAADLCSIGLRARPLDPPPKPRNPFEDGGPLV